MTNSDEMLTRYLFGELPESEQSRLEERYFSDAQTFEQLVQLETDLIDSYNRGGLSAEMRGRFERAYLTNPNRRARVKFSEGLVAKLDLAAASPNVNEPVLKPTSWWQQFSLSTTMGQRALALLLAFVLLLVSAATIWLLIQNRRLQQDLSISRGQQTEQEKLAREAEQRLIDERTRTQQLSADLDQVRAERNLQLMSTTSQSPSTIASLVLMVTGVRGAETGAAPKLVIHKETLKVQLLLKLRENEYQSYQLTLQAVGGHEIYNRRHIKPGTAKSGASLNIALPASKLAAGDYILTLKGLTASGNLEDVSQRLFRVEKD